jgi:cyclopropane fatty-acyl-phospholipid synthase-like methyltransferase
MSNPSHPWNEIFRREGRLFTEPHEAMPRIVGTLTDLGAIRVLDLGCGTGRHVVYLAERGFSVFGLDSSAEANKASRAWLAEERLEATLHLHDMKDSLPFHDRFFDAVVSVQVIHHACVSTITHTVRELERVLRPGGLLFVTVPTRRNQGERFKEIEENTLVPLNGPEKGLPHHYFTARELRELFSNFDVRAIDVDSVAHYCVTALKRNVGEKNGVGRGTQTT